MRAAPLLMILAGCIDGLTQVAGTGAVYYTRCSADMIQEAGEYRTQCTPQDCTAGFEPGPIGHVVVALDPGRKVVGVAERLCVQDLSRASALFNPPPATRLLPGRIALPEHVPQPPPPTRGSNPPACLPTG